jgi:hypothetical protein
MHILIKLLIEFLAQLAANLIKAAKRRQEQKAKEMEKTE